MSTLFSNKKRKHVKISKEEDVPNNLLEASEEIVPGQRKEQFSSAFSELGLGKSYSYHIARLLLGSSKIIVKNSRCSKPDDSLLLVVVSRKIILPTYNIHNHIFMHAL